MGSASAPAGSGTTAAGPSRDPPRTLPGPATARTSTGSFRSFHAHPGLTFQGEIFRTGLSNRFVVHEHRLEVLDGLFQPLIELNLRLPVEELARQGDVRLALRRVIGRQWPAFDLRFRAGDGDDLLGELDD